MPLFSSKIASILTLIGVAVGLGNVWRFPYMMGKYGGSAFLFTYLVFTVLFAVPALMGEITLGRATRQGPIGAFRSALGRTAGDIIGYLLTITILVASSYYAVVIANVFFAAYFSIRSGFSNDQIVQFSADLDRGNLQYSIGVVVILSAIFIIHRGLNQGIEWASKAFVPFFLIVIVFLIAYTLSLPGARMGLVSFLKPDFSQLIPINIFAALGQAFYSLSLGGTFMVVYGSYLSSEHSIMRISLWTAFGDVGAALLTSLFIVPTILIFQLDMTSGPTLIFETLPHLFSEIPAGRFVGSIFLVALGLVAFLSLVAALDVARSCLQDIMWIRWNRTSVIIGIGFIELLLSYPSALDANVVGLLDLVFGSGMQVLGSGLSVIAVAWGLKKALTRKELSTPSKDSHFSILFTWFQWIIPAVLLFVLIGYIYNTIQG